MTRKILKFGAILLFVAAVTFVLYLLNEKSLSGIDDANIYFIYMRNFAQGHGFVYNVGGERVEGFTSLLWCLSGALYFRIFHSPETLLLITNLLAVSYALFKLTEFADDYFGDCRFISPYTFFLLMALFVLPGYFEWTMLSLLETGIWSALLILGGINLLRWETDSGKAPVLNRQLAGLLLLLVLTRPESYVWGSVFVGIRLLQLYRYPWERKDAWARKALWPVLAFAGTAAGMVVWRLSYFGYPLPNTYYAKVSQDAGQNLAEGALYIWNVIQFANPFLLSVPLILLLYILSSAERKWSNAKIILLIIILVTALVPLYSGGDHFWLGRLLQPTLPLVYLAVCVFAKDLLTGDSVASKNIYPKLIVALLALFLLPARDSLLGSLKSGSGAIRMEFIIGKYDRFFGERLNTFFADLPAYPSQGVLTAGGNAFRYKGQTIDLLGLNNVAMAHADRIKTRGVLKGHASFNKDVFYRQQPDLVWMSPIHFIPLADTASFTPPENEPAFEQDLANLAFKGIAYDARFRQTYFPVYLYKTGDGDCLFAYAHKDLLARLPQPLYTYRILPRTR